MTMSRNGKSQNAEADSGEPLSEFVRELDHCTEYSDRLYLAIRYVTEDLTEEQSGVFEAKLADDVEWCDLVVEATRLVAALAESCEDFHTRKSGTRTLAVATSAPVLTATPAATLSLLSATRNCGMREQRPRGSAFASVALSLAACVLVFAATMLVDSSQKIQSASRSPLGQSELLHATELLAIYTVGGSERSTGLPFDDDERLDVGELKEISVPDWMVAAVRLEDFGSSGQHSGASSADPERDFGPGSDDGSDETLINQVGNDRRNAGATL